MAENKEIVAGGKTAAQIKEMKEKHGELTLVTIKHPDRYFWFKKPDMNTLAAAAAMAERDPMGSTLIYFNNCLVDGDHTASERVDDWVAIAPHLQGLIKEQEVEVSKF